MCIQACKRNSARQMGTPSELICSKMLRPWIVSQSLIWISREPIENEQGGQFKGNL